MLRELSQIIGYFIPLKDSTSTQSDDSGTVAPFTGNTGYPDEASTGDTDLSALAGLYDEAPTTAANMASNAMPGSEINDQTEPLSTSETATSLEATHQAISQGEDPGTLLEATASGPAPNTEGGHGFVQVALLGQHTTPTSGINASLSTDDFDSPTRPVQAPNQQPLDFSNTLDITGIQEDGTSNSFAITNIKGLAPIELGTLRITLRYDDLVIEGPEPNSGSFFYIQGSSSSHSVSSFQNMTPGPTVELPPTVGTIIFTDEVL